MIRTLIKKIAQPFFMIWFKWYSSKPRTYTYKNLSVSIPPEVFSPRFTISTKLLLDYISKLELYNKSVLELGCGSGIISLLAASKGAKVTASDINPIALKALEKSSAKNNLEISIIHSDLFKDIPKQYFDYIIINPPYYPKAPKNHKEQAWFCGENFEYFIKLFSDLISYTDSKNIWMILSNDCEIAHIKSIASSNGLYMKKIFKKNVMFERNYIYKITSL